MLIFWLVMQIPIAILSVGVWYVFYQTVHMEKRPQHLQWLILAVTYFAAAAVYIINWPPVWAWLIFLVGHGLSISRIFELSKADTAKVLVTVAFIRFISVGIADVTIYKMGSNLYEPLWLTVVTLYFLTILAVILIWWQKQLERKEAAAREVYQKTLQEKHDELQLWMHDMKNHLSCIRGLMELNDYQGAIEYIQNMDDKLKASSVQKFTDNMVANILLAEKKQQAEAEEMEFEFYSDGVSLAFIDGADLCAILGNLLDNALEGSRKSEDKTIQIDVYEEASGIVKITVINSSDQAPLVKKQRLESTKLDSQKHGYGLRSVEQAAKRYGGRLLVGYDEVERSFRAAVTLHPQKGQALLQGNMKDMMEVRG